MKRFAAKLASFQRNAVAAEAPIPLIGFATDIEGNWSYWNNYIKISYVLRRHGNELELRENCHFVYGGDVCDRGDGDLRVIQDILSLKRRYPNRVHIVLGNRDVNKLRLRFELCEHTLRHKGNVHWIQKSQNTGNSRPAKLSWVC